MAYPVLVMRITISPKMQRTCGNTQEFFVCSLSRLSPVVNRNGRKDGGQH